MKRFDTGYRVANRFDPDVIVVPTRACVISRLESEFDSTVVEQIVIAEAPSAKHHGAFWLYVRFCVRERNAAHRRADAPRHSARPQDSAHRSNPLLQPLHVQLQPKLTRAL